MKRDMNIIRQLILLLEESKPGLESDDIDLELDAEVIDYHLRLMASAELIVVTMTRGGIIFQRLTWAGHDFADASRDDTVWRRTMKKVQEKTKSVSFDVFVSLLKSALSKALLE